MKHRIRAVALILAATLLSGCQNGTPAETTTAPVTTPAPAPETTPAPTTTVPETTPVPTTTVPETTPTPTFVLEDTAVPSGTLVKSNEYAIIDYSNTGDGYVMAKFTAETQQRLKAQVKGPETTYTFNLTPGVWAVFPLAQGNGTYKVSVFENVTGNKYALMLSAYIEVTLTDEFAPFLRSNQFVNFDDAPETVNRAGQLCQGAHNLEKVELVYDFVVEGMVYDYDLASSVKSGYVPDLDAVLEKKAGICFDYAALMTGMLRSQGVPCKLVVGYAGQIYHAWISVWSEETGWVEAMVFFDGTSWKRMDPTFASSAQGDQEILDYIRNDQNYTAKYIY